MFIGRVFTRVVAAHRGSVISSTGLLVRQCLEHAEEAVLAAPVMIYDPELRRPEDAVATLADAINHACPTGCSVLSVFHDATSALDATPDAALLVRFWTRAVVDPTVALRVVALTETTTSMPYERFVARPVSGLDERTWADFEIAAGVRQEFRGGEIVLSAA